MGCGHSKQHGDVVAPERQPVKNPPVLPPLQYIPRTGSGSTPNSAFRASVNEIESLTEWSPDKSQQTPGTSDLEMIYPT